MIKLLIVDDEPAVRKGLRMRLASEPEVEVVGEAASGEEALTLVETLRPDVVLMDVALPQMDGVAATRALLTTFPQLTVIILTIHDDEATRARARAAGAAAFITKRGLNGELLAAIRLASKQAEGQSKCQPAKKEGYPSNTLHPRFVDNN